jgi:predicted small lipoprotein YifL
MKIATLMLGLLLTACGQSGDLYLPPPEPAPPESAAPAAEPAPTPATEPARKKKD